MHSRHDRRSSAPDHRRLVYLRFHGNRYSGSYAPETLKTEARWIKQQLGDGKDVFAYFNNDAEGHAPRNAAELKQYVVA